MKCSYDKDWDISGKLTQNFFLFLFFLSISHGGEYDMKPQSTCEFHK